MNRLRLQLAAVWISSLFVVGCVLNFAGSDFQSLEFTFEVSETLPAELESVVHTVGFPSSLSLKKRFLNVSGSLEGPFLPSRIDLEAEIRDATGARVGTVKLKLPIAPDGGFDRITKLKRNLTAGSLVTITVAPSSEDLEEGTRVHLCVDVLQRKSDRRSCAPIDVPAARFSEIQASVFSPSCAKSGCHDAATASAGLVLEESVSYADLVGVPSNQVPFRLRVEPGSAENSYLMKKLLGSSDTQGVRMPLDGPPFLSDELLAGIEGWIESGAPNN